MGGDGRQQSGGGPDTIARSGSPSLRAEQVIEAGLVLYSQGDLVGALSCWRQALEIDPENRRAREYVTYVEEHYEVLHRRLSGEQPVDEPGQTIEMEADDPMDELDAYESVELSMPEVDAPPAGLPDIDGRSPTEEMKPQQAISPGSIKIRVGDDDDITGEEATKAEGLAGRRRAGPRTSQVPMPKPKPMLEESVDEGWSLDGLEDSLGLGESLADVLDDVLGPREDVDTVEMAARPSFIDDLSDLGTRAETGNPFDDDDAEPPSAIQRPSDDSTGEVTRPEGRGRPDSGRHRRTERSNPPPMPGVSPVTPFDPAARSRAEPPVGSPPRAREPSDPPPSISTASDLSPKSEFDLADFDDPDVPALGPAGGAVMTTRPMATVDERAAEVRVTFRNPRESEVPEAKPRATTREETRPGEDEESTVDRLQPLASLDSFLGPAGRVVDDVVPSFDDETYERPSLSTLAEAAADLDSLYGDSAESDDLRIETARPGSEGDTGTGDASERETTKLYQRDIRAQGAVSMELIAAELEGDLDEAVSIDPSFGSARGEDAIKSRVSWLIARARSEMLAGHFPVAVVAIDLALEQHPDSAVAQKLIHSNRDVLYEVFRSFLGDMRAVPSLAMPMEKIALHDLDHRAAFLLSRIDGVLTLEDVLDVSGMARLEALRHLSRLLLRGILELRS